MKPSGRRRRPDNSAGKGGHGGSRTRFAVDAMHGSLARKLRAIGFDASYYGRGGDAGIMELAAREGRVILSSDRALVSGASTRGLPAVLLKGRTDRSRMGEISMGASRLGIDLLRGDSLCSLCGGELQTLSKTEVSGQVPPSVERRHRLFYRCASCGQIYWHGGHWKKLRSFARRLDEVGIASPVRNRKERRQAREGGH